MLSIFLKDNCLKKKYSADNERRRGIIVTVAHELRTPLQPILGYLNLLIQDPEGFGIPEDTKRILERCLAERRPGTPDH